MSIESLLREFAEKIRAETSAEVSRESAYTDADRKAVRESAGIPAWVMLGHDDPDFIRIFQEDDTKPPDAERAGNTWKRIYNESYDATKAVATWDGGDCTAYLMPDNRVYECSYDGAIIYQWLPPRKFE